MKNRLVAFLLLFAFCPTLFGGSPATSAPDFDPKRLAAHVNFLASDLLEGRGTGTRGYDIAAAYMAAQFAEAGLKPGGNGDSFLQKVPFRKADVVPEECSFVITPQNGSAVTFKYAEDFILSNDYERPETSVTAPVVFAGFGVTAPDQKYDDYAALDAKGKIVLILSGAPAQFPHDQRAHYSSGRVKEENAVKHGAIGMLNFNSPIDEPRRPWDRMVRQSKMSGYNWLKEDGHPGNYYPEIQLYANLSHEGAEKLLSNTAFPLKKVFDMVEKKSLQTFALPFQISVKRVSKLENATSYNVVGILEGSDPHLKNEYIIYSAHLDHLGIGSPVKGDTIYNGAYDNGSGSAALIELARAFRQLPHRPRRSIMFLSVTGEEKGLQGSEYFAEYPTVPAPSLIADINLDMFLMLYPLADAVIYGQEHSSLGQTAAESVVDAGLKVSSDPFPEEVIFVRSDQYSFVRKGIPSVMFDSGFHSTDPSIHGEELTRQWLRTNYHSPQDDLSQKFDWTSGVKIINAAFLTGLRTANQTKPPAWVEGDFFGRLYGRKRAHAH